MPAISEKYAVKVASYQQKDIFVISKEIFSAKNYLSTERSGFQIDEQHSPMSRLM